MKKYSIFYPLFLGLTLFISCEKSKLMTYDSEHLLYFSIPSVDSVSVNFSILGNEVKDSVLRVPIQLLGRLLESPTPYFLNINGQSTTAVTGQDFSLPMEFIFPAHKNRDTLLIKLNKTAKMKEKEVDLVLEIAENSVFNSTVFSMDKTKSLATKIKITITDILKPTRGWENQAGKLGTEYYLGKFTKKKLQIILEVWGSGTFESLYKGIDQYRVHYSNILNNYLIAQQKAGTPVLEEDGTAMEVGEFYKKK